MVVDFEDALDHYKAMTSAKKTIIFVHGLWLHASSWEPWMDFFQKAGYETLAPGWPGDEDTVIKTRNHPEKIAGVGINDAAEHYTKIIKSLKEKPILIGHSFGGLLVQKLLGEDLAAGAVAIDPAQMRGVLPLPLAQLKSGFPVLKNPFNITMSVTLTADEFRYSFGNAIPPKESNELYDKWTIPAPGKPLFSGAFANFNPNTEDHVNVSNSKRGPLLLISGGKDHTVPSVVTKAAFKLYKNSSAITEFKEFPDRGHSLTIDKGWKEIAEFSLKWLQKNSL
jgi:pimeloyl-ACP methyl ester carboxylesterase